MTNAETYEQRVQRTAFNGCWPTRKTLQSELTHTREHMAANRYPVDFNQSHIDLLFAVAAVRGWVLQ